MSSTRTNNPPAAALSAILPTFELNGVSKWNPNGGRVVSVYQTQILANFIQLNTPEKFRA